MIRHLNRDAPQEPVAKSAHASPLNGLEQKVERPGANEECQPPFVQVAPENSIGLGRGLPRDEGDTVRVAKVVITSRGFDERRKRSLLRRRLHDPEPNAYFTFNAKADVGGEVTVP